MPREYDAQLRDVTYFSPDRIDWTLGDHDVTCFANFDAQRSDPMETLYSCSTRSHADLSYTHALVMPKMKTHSGAKKRFKLTANGKVRARHPFSSHILEKKSPKKKTAMSRPLILNDHDAPRVKKLLGTKSK